MQHDPLTPTKGERPTSPEGRRLDRVTAPLDVEKSALQADPDAAVSGLSAKAVEGRSLRQIAWMRLKRDKVALGGGIVILLLIRIAVFAPLIVKLLGHPPNDFHQELLDPTLLTPKGSFGGISSQFLLGVEPVNGRDVFSRIVYGARISLLTAFLATLLSVSIGTVVGITAGFFGGWIDGLISRLMDILLAFPLLVFAISIGTVIQTANGSVFGLSGTSLSVATLIFIIGFFNWPYIGRIVRGQTHTLREKEFIDAARSLGATNRHIIFKQLLPNLAAPVLVYSTLIIPTNILFEAALSFLGVGVRRPTASWGSMLSDAVETYQIDPVFMIVPGVALLITVMAFNLLGDGLRDALDPRAGR
jgi:peptide/nickel transport system permease protein/oligopeptide transport system permease protein